MPTKILKDHLENHKVKYSSILHSPAFTAQEVAAAAHISGKIFAKTVIIKIGEKFAMVVLPANDHVNFVAIKELTGQADINLASELDFKNKFPECEVGAMAPFGDLYGMPVYVSGALALNSKIVFNAGTHSELIQMSYQDFEKLVKPKVIALH